MEDKELQELLDAKRWQLENRQQQEEIASRIGSRRIVWPWWVGSTAAAILAVLLLSPVLFGGKEELIAKAEKIEEIESIESMERIEKVEKTIAKATTKNTSISPIESTESIPSTESIESIPSIEPIPSATPDSASPAPSAPRVHTRRSHRLADVEKAPEKPRVPALIAQYINIPDSIFFTNDIVINLK